MRAAAFLPARRVPPFVGFFRRFPVAARHGYGRLDVDEPRQRLVARDLQRRLRLRRHADRAARRLRPECTRDAGLAHHHAELGRRVDVRLGARQPAGGRLRRRRPRQRLHPRADVHRIHHDHRSGQPPGRRPGLPQCDGPMRRRHKARGGESMKAPERRRSVLLLLLIASPLLAQTNTDNANTCDIAVTPAATLLLPTSKWTPAPRWAPAPPLSSPSRTPAATRRSRTSPSGPTGPTPSSASTFFSPATTCSASICST